MGRANDRSRIGGGRRMTEQEALNSGAGFRRNSWKAFVYFLPFIKPHLRRLILICLVDIAITLINLAVPWFGKQIIDKGFPDRDWNFVLVVAGAIAGLTG